MPQFRVHRMKHLQRESFRWAPHVSAESIVKPKDYEPAGEVAAQHEYDAWVALRSTENPLSVGDLLENEAGELRICKYVGFERAIWLVAEAIVEKPATEVQ